MMSLQAASVLNLSFGQALLIGGGGTLLLYLVYRALLGLARRLPAARLAGCLLLCGLVVLGVGAIVANDLGMLQPIWTELDCIGQAGSLTLFGLLMIWSLGLLGRGGALFERNRATKARFLTTAVTLFAVPSVFATSYLYPVMPGTAILLGIVFGLVSVVGGVGTIFLMCE